jgi:hypothetical protein
MTIPDNRDEARALISSVGITCENVTNEQIKSLMDCLQTCFKAAPNYRGTMRVKERKPSRFFEYENE